jgi:RNA polymerase sigma-70 factor (ECF subfamily)
VVLLRPDEGRIAAIDSFLDPAVCRRFGMLDELS